MGWEPYPPPADAGINPGMQVALDSKADINSLPISGQVDIVFSGGNSATTSVVFPVGKFASTPIVVTSLRTGALGIVSSATSVTADGCNINGQTGSGGNYTGTVRVSWVAVL